MSADYMSNMMLVKEYAGMVLIPLVMMLYSSPILAVRSIIQRKSTGKYEFLPYLLMFANCFVWTTFCFIRGVKVMYEPLVVNSYGLFVTLAALLVYARYITEDAVRASFLRKVPLTVLCLLLLAVAAFTSGTNDCTDPSSLTCWWGKFCIVVNSALFVGPFVAFREAWLSKSVEFMPLASLVSGMIASLDCSVYFFCLSDINGLIPNLAGVALSAVQIGFYAYMVFKYPQKQVEFVKVDPVIDESQAGSLAPSRQTTPLNASKQSTPLIRSRQTTLDAFSRQITPYTLITVDRPVETPESGADRLTERLMGS